jgi:hypothetical protein
MAGQFGAPYLLTAGSARRWARDESARGFLAEILFAEWDPIDLGDNPRLSNEQFEPKLRLRKLSHTYKL